MARIAGCLMALGVGACAGTRPVPAPLDACAEPSSTMADAKAQSLLQGVLKIYLPPEYLRQDPSENGPAEVWLAAGQGVVAIDRLRLAPARADSIRAPGCRKVLAGRQAYVRTGWGGDFEPGYSISAAWEEAPDDWIYVVAIAQTYASHAAQFEALHTLRVP